MSLEVMSNCNECEGYISNHAKIYCEKCFKAYGIKRIAEFKVDIIDTVNFQHIIDAINEFPGKTIQLYIREKR